MINPKKIIGSLGRKYGGNTFRAVRKFCYDTVAIPSRFGTMRDVMRKRYGKRSACLTLYETDATSFFKAYYSQGKGDVEKEGVICLFDGLLPHGGITDRIRGILTTWREAKRRGLPFYICWTWPFRLEDYLVPADVDWRIDISEVSRLEGDAFPVMVEETPMYHSHFENSLKLRLALKNRRRQTHVYTNADNAKGEYSTLYRELFRPSDKLRKALDSHLSVLGEGYQAFSFRFIGLLGDFKDYVKHETTEEEAVALMEKVAAEFMRMASGIPSEKRILVTSDSGRFLNYIKDMDRRIYIVPGDVQHTDYAEGADGDLWLKTFLDQHLLMNASRVTLMRTGEMYRSGFPRFAAEVGGSEFVDHHF